jgi:hypothetical protein
MAIAPIQMLHKAYDQDPSTQMEMTVGGTLGISSNNFYVRQSSRGNAGFEMWVGQAGNPKTRVVKDSLKLKDIIPSSSSVLQVSYLRDDAAGGSTITGVYDDGAKTLVVTYGVDIPEDECEADIVWDVSGQVNDTIYGVNGSPGFTFWNGNGDGRATFSQSNTGS